MNFLRNSKLGAWPPDPPDLVNLNYDIMSFSSTHSPTNTEKQSHVTWLMIEYMHTHTLQLTVCAKSSNLSFGKFGKSKLKALKCIKI